MGYRSDWKLAINAATNEKLIKTIQWMEDYSKDTSINEDCREIMEFILSCEEARGDTYVEFYETYTKCYNPWDSVIQDIFDHAEEDEELDAAYARFGEESDDNDVRNGSWTYVYIERSLSDVDYCDIPEQKQEDVGILKQDLLGVPKPIEEKCGCGKMKDAGKPCWWCGA